MIHPDTEVRFISPEIGYGVVAIRFIPKGTITWVLDKLDREFLPEEVIHLDEVYQKIIGVYSYRNNKGNLVLCWDNARFVNHSFKSNCLSTAYDFEIAIRDIHPGEQLTDDYGYLNVEHPFEAVDEGTDRKVVYPDDLLRMYKIWDDQLKPMFPLINQVVQPLGELVPDKTWEMINAIASGKKEMDSILVNYYKDPQLAFFSQNGKNSA